MIFCSDLGTPLDAGIHSHSKSDVVKLVAGAVLGADAVNETLNETLNEAFNETFDEWVDELVDGTKSLSQKGSAP